MKKVTAFVGSAHKKNTHQAAAQFLTNLASLGAVEGELVALSDYKLGLCRGCRVCFEKGEEYCPLKDDRDVLLEKIAAADGVVFATPNYTFDLSGIMKVFLDRLGFACHRPRYFGKTFTSIVTQGIGRGGEIVKYFDFLANILGFNPVKGVCVTALDPRTEQQQRQIDRALEGLSRRFYARMMQPAFPEPSWFMLMGFRMGRTTVRQQADPQSRDYTYYTEKGWFSADYFYPIRLGLPKRTAGKLFDTLAPGILKMLA